MAGGPVIAIVCDNPCVIMDNRGGAVSYFVELARYLKTKHIKLVINGYCASSCMTMADMARPNVCITGRAIFGYHKTNWNRPIPLSRDVNAWVVRHGGFPAFEQNPGIMRNREARQFWKICKQD